MKIKVEIKKSIFSSFKDYGFKNIDDIDLSNGTPVVPYLDNVNAYPSLGKVVSVSKENGRCFAIIDFVKKPFLVRKPTITKFSWFPHDGKILIVCLGVPNWFNLNPFTELTTL